jgi:hypothetical protein
VSNLSPGQGEYLLNIWCISKMLIVDRGSMYCNSSGGACFFFDIDVKGGEKSLGGESECMWVLVLPSMPKGEIVGKYLTDSEQIANACH